MRRTYKEIIRQDYFSAIMPEIKLIDGKYPYSRGYECLSLSEFLKICFPDKISFIDEGRLIHYNKYLDATFPGFRSHVDKYAYLKQRQLLPEISRIDIGQLKFYQDEINVDGLDKLVNEDYFLQPVLVVKFENELILQDGYHRTFIAIVDKISLVECYIV